MDISLVIYHSHLHSHSPQPLLELRKDCLCRSNSGNPGILLYGNRNDLIVFCDDYVALESNNILISILGRVKSTVNGIAGLMTTLERGEPSKGVASKTNPRALANVPLSSARNLIAVPIICHCNFMHVERRTKEYVRVPSGASFSFQAL